MSTPKSNARLASLICNSKKFRQGHKIRKKDIKKLIKEAKKKE
jgi:hypothetical protein